MILFLDTNIYLSFYYLSIDDLEELKKLIILLEKKECDLVITDQVIDEFSRNRDNKINEAIENFKSQRLDFRFPHLCKDYPEFEEMRSHQKSYSDLHGRLLNKILADVNSKHLKADDIIQNLFSKSKRIPCNEETYNFAHIRYEIGNPPGKKESLGDAINWESLLKNIVNGSDLCFISDDKDFISPLNNNKFNPFLYDEWKNKKESELIFFKSLSSFFGRFYPDISIASDLEKGILISRLSNSPSFADTHAIIYELSKYPDFSVNHSNAIVGAAISNDQVYWIITDEDVKDFLMRVVSAHIDDIEPSNLDELLHYIYPNQDEVAF